MRSLTLTLSLLACLFQVGKSGPARAGERYVLSDLSVISFYDLEDGQLIKREDILKNAEWRTECLPVLRKSTNTIFFESNLWSDYSDWIYEAPLEPHAEDKARKIVNGRGPALSPDEQRLAFTTQQGELRVLELASGNSVALDQGVFSNPPVWLDNSHLLYALDLKLDKENPQNNLVLLDTKSGEREVLPFSGLIPAVRVPGSNEILCGDYSGRSITLLNMDTRSVRDLVRSKLYSIGYAPVLRPDGLGFLYARQSWRNWVKLLLEATSIYVRDFEGNEALVSETSRLCGGFFLDTD